MRAVVSLNSALVAGRPVVRVRNVNGVAHFVPSYNVDGRDARTVSARAGRSAVTITLSPEQAAEFNLNGTYKAEFRKDGRTFVLVPVAGNRYDAKVSPKA